VTGWSGVAGWRTVAAGWRGVILLKNQAQYATARFLTVAEVAGLLRVSSMTVYRLINAGELPAVRVGKSYRLREDDVDRYLAARYTEAG
jgi:excisionase family DNA binding protein